MNSPIYSFVIPVYNEEAVIPELYRQLNQFLEKLDGEAEVILVDDGSRDNSYPMLLEIHKKDPRFKIVHFARNFGHQIAVSAGIDFSSGQAVIIMDADLQDPLEVVLQLIERWREGYEVVYAVRERRQKESLFKKATAAVFYRVLRSLTDVDMPVDTGDFRLVDRRAVDTFKQLRENNRFVRGMFSWIGFKQVGVKYVRQPRIAGETKYPLRKMIRFALNGIISFSSVPLRWILNLGFLVSAVSFLLGLFMIYQKLSGGYVVSGWTSLIVATFFMGGVQLMVIGVIGEYIGRIYDEVKQRPLYVVKDTHGV